VIFQSHKVRSSPSGTGLDLENDYATVKTTIYQSVYSFYG
jgi:hypothetical protein